MFGWDMVFIMNRRHGGHHEWEARCSLNGRYGVHE